MGYYRNITSEEEENVLWKYQCGLIRNNDSLLSKFFDSWEFTSRVIEIDRIKANIHFENEYRISDMRFTRDTFDKDDLKQADKSKICKNYIKHWPEMYKNNIGILFYGSIGTGKTFFANAIVNCLISYGVKATSTSFPRLFNLLYSAKDKQAFLDGLSIYDLLVIDDFGVERDSKYSFENIYNILNARYSSGKPIIVTTNLQMKDMVECKNTQYSSLYSRLLEVCSIHIKMNGNDRRKEEMKRKQEIAKRLLLE